MQTGLKFSALHKVLPLVALIVGLFCVPTYGQAVGDHKVRGVVLTPVTVANLPTCDSSDTRLGRLQTVNDGLTTSDCTIGGGTEVVFCKCDGTSWTAIGSGSGGGGEPSDGDKTDITVSASGTVWLINAGAVGPTEVDEASINLQDFGGAVTDAQVPNNITIDLATTATTANAGDSATAFFSTGSIEDARIPDDITIDPAGSDTQVQFNNAGTRAGDSGLTYNAATDTLTVGTISSSGSGAGSLTLNDSDASQSFTLSAPTNLTANRTCTVDDDATPLDGCVTHSTECSTASCDLDSATTLNSQMVCLNDGTNCPTSGSSANVIVSARKGTAGTINKGQPVYISGWNNGQSVIEVELADADDATLRPAVGLVFSSTLTSSTNGQVILSGDMENVDTSSYAIGDALYVDSTAGLLTNVKPTSIATGIQKIGTVANSNASNGVIFVTGAGRINDIPNFQTHYQCGDEDADGNFNDADIDSCINAVSAAGGGVVQLECTTWTLDPDGDGVGESRCNTYTNTKNPHVCMQANVHLKGCGPGSTILDLGTQTTTPSCPAGQAFYIGSDIESNTDTTPTARLDNWGVSDLTIQGEGGCGDGGCNSSSVGVGLWHGDDIFVRNVEFRNLDQAGCHMNSCTDCICDSVDTYRTGAWDYDGPDTVGTCTPDNAQPASYMYVSGGRVSKGNVISNVKSLETGSRGFSLRTGTNIQRPGPLGTVSVEFTASTSESIAQTFLADNVSNINTGIVLACAQLQHIDTTTDTDGTGDVDFSIQTTSAGAPTGTAVTNHDTSDYEQVDGALIGQAGGQTCWLNTTLRDANGDTNITDNTTYAAVWTYTTASTNSNVMAILGDETSTDTYPSGATYNYNGSTWSAAGTGFDLNFTLQDGVHIEPVFENISIDTMSGTDGSGGTCFNVEGGLSPIFRKISCKDTGGSVIGAFPNFGTNLDTVSYDGSVNSPGAMLTIQTQTHSPSPFRGVKIEDPGAGVNCITTENSTSGITFDGATLIRCGDSAFKVQGFTKRMSVINSTILDPDGNGVFFDTQTDADGEDGGFTGIRVQNTLIDGSQLYPIEFDNTNGVINGAVITGNVLRNAGAGVMRLRGTHSGMVITNNLFDGWALRSTAATDRRGIYVNPTSISGVISQNFYRATSGNEVSIFDMRPTNADGLVVRDNIGEDVGGGITTDPISYTAPTTLANRYEFTNNYVIGHADGQNDDGQVRISGKEAVTDGDSCGTEGYQRGDVYQDTTGSDGTATELCICDGTNWQCVTF